MSDKMNLDLVFTLASLKEHDRKVGNAKIEECALLMEESPVMATDYYVKRIRALKQGVSDE